MTNLVGRGNKGNEEHFYLYSCVPISKEMIKVGYLVILELVVMGLTITLCCVKVMHWSTSRFSRKPYNKILALFKSAV